MKKVAFVANILKIKYAEEIDPITQKSPEIGVMETMLPPPPTPVKDIILPGKQPKLDPERALYIHLINQLYNIADFVGGFSKEEKFELEDDIRYDNNFPSKQLINKIDDAFESVNAAFRTFYKRYVTDLEQNYKNNVSAFKLLIGKYKSIAPNFSRSKGLQS